MNETKPKVVIIGASFIGMEAAAMMSKLAESVTVVALESVPLERVLGPEVGRVFQRLHEKNGICFHLNATVKEFLPKKDKYGHFGAVELHDGQIIHGDIVILGVGIKLVTDFAREAGLPTLPDGGISVDANLQVVGHSNIYAAGDIATFPCQYSCESKVRIEHWDVALQQGRIAGYNMAANSVDEMKPYNSVPFFFTNQYGKSLRYTGSAHGGYDSVHIDGDLEAEQLNFAAYYISTILYY